MRPAPIGGDVVAGDYIIPGYGRCNQSPSSTLVYTTERYSTTTSYVKKYEMRVPFSGTIRVYFKMGITNNAYTSYGAIYVNDSLAATAHSGASESSYATYYDDIPVAAGDLVQLYGKVSNAAASGLYKSFALCHNGIGELYQ
jgi:hypothetical protein